MAHHLDFTTVVEVKLRAGDTVLGQHQLCLPTTGISLAELCDRVRDLVPTAFDQHERTRMLRMCVFSQLPNSPTRRRACCVPLYDDAVPGRAAVPHALASDEGATLLHHVAAVHVVHCHAVTVARRSPLAAAFLGVEPCSSDELLATMTAAANAQGTCRVTRGGTTTWRCALSPLPGTPKHPQWTLTVRVQPRPATAGVIVPQPARTVVFHGGVPRIGHIRVASLHILMEQGFVGGANDWELVADATSIPLDSMALSGFPVQPFTTNDCLTLRRAAPGVLRPVAVRPTPFVERLANVVVVEPKRGVPADAATTDTMMENSSYVSRQVPAPAKHSETPDAAPESPHCRAFDPARDTLGGFLRGETFVDTGRGVRASFTGTATS